VYQEERVVRAVRIPVSTDAELKALASSRRCSINQLVAEAVEGLVRTPAEPNTEPEVEDEPEAQAS